MVAGNCNQPTTEMHKPRPWLRRLLRPFIGRRAFARDENGAVLVEFGILAVPFFTLIYAILETALVFFGGQILDSAVHDATRAIRTGQAQSPTPPATAWNLESFRSEVCDGLYGMFNCDQLRVKVQVLNDFTSAVLGDPIDPDCEVDQEDETECGWALLESYNAGVGSSVVLVQVHYKWPTLINLPYFDLATLAGGKRLMSAARVFKNEPF